MEPISKVKIVLLGDSGVGKSSILSRYISESFSSNPLTTTGASYMEKIIVFGGHSVKLHIWDTAGQERYRGFARSYYGGATQAIMVYDITNRNSFIGLEKWYNDLREFGPATIHIFVVGNKIDLKESEEVSQDEAQAFADRIGAIYRGCSALIGLGIEDIFRDIALEYISGVCGVKCKCGKMLVRGEIHKCEEERKESVKVERIGTKRCFCL